MSVSQPVDSSILHEIVRVIESRRKVPEKVVVKSREYQLTYLEDHQRRMEEALMRYDADRLNMLYGQLASKIKYQLLRRLPARAAEAVTLGAAPAKRAAGAKKPAGARKAAPAKKIVAGKKSPAKAAARARPARKAAAAKTKKAAGATRAAAKRRPAKRPAKAAKRHK